jgi:hypothetical protein
MLTSSVFVLILHDNVSAYSLLNLSNAEAFQLGVVSNYHLFDYLKESDIKGSDDSV